jgi:outer membrane protein OmpA-like peptidoglycan-associated protein
MRSTITAISSLLFGASVLIFILALLIPLLRESPSQAGKGETIVHESLAAFKKTIAGLLEQEHSQSPAASHDLQPSIMQPQDEVAQNQAKELNASAQPVDASGLSSPIAPNEPAIDPSQGELGAMQSPQPSIAQIQDQVAQNQSKELNASTQPVDAPGPSSPIAPNESAIEPSQGELGIMPSSQTSPEAIPPQINEKSTKPVKPADVEKKSPSLHGPVRLLVLGKGLFPVGQGTPKAKVQEAIGKIIPLIKERSLDKVVIEGHADKWVPAGVSAIRVSNFNKIVSLQRARAVAKVLEQKGVARGRIIVKGLGDAVPIASNLTREGRAQNRRVEIKLIPAQ